MSRRAGFWLALCMALVIGGARATPVGAATYVTSYGGISSSLFDLPESLATDPQGNLFVASPFGAGFNKLRPSGNQIFLHSSLGNGPGQFVNGPNGTATDAAGHAYFSDECTASSSLCCPSSPCDTVDRVEVFDGDGNFLRDIGTPGTGNGQFEGPRGLATDSAGNLYVADSGNDRIEKFTSLGGYLGQWNGGLFEPEGVAINSADHVFTTDFDHVRVFTSSGSPITSWDGSSSGSGPFNQPRGIAVDRNGHVYVADSFNSRVEVFDSSATSFLPLAADRGADRASSVPGRRASRSTAPAISRLRPRQQPRPGLERIRGQRHPLRLRSLGLRSLGLRSLGLRSLVEPNSQQEALQAQEEAKNTALRLVRQEEEVQKRRRRSTTTSAALDEKQTS